MAIPLTEYVSITSGIGGNSTVGTRMFIGNLFTTNLMIDPLVPMVFTSASDVGAYLGTTSEEYLRAVKYFGYLSPSVRVPQALMISRLVREDSPARIFGAKTSFVLATLKTIVAGTISFVFAGTTVTVTGVDLSAATDLAGVASALQTAFRLNVDTHLATCTVTYDAIASNFQFVSTTTGIVAGTFTLAQAGSGLTDLALHLGWYASSGAKVISSAIVTTPVDIFTETVNLTNNFGSFCFTTASELTLDEIVAVATYNATLNVEFLYHVVVSPSDYAETSAALITNPGFAMTYQLDSLNQYPEMIPMAIQGATDYTQRNGVMNYKYRQIPNMTASVTDLATKRLLDAALVNYYGMTQEAGQNVSFYQNGVVCGLATNPQWMNIYANEAWLKDYIASGILNLQLALPELSADRVGKGQLMTVIQDGIDSALHNGTISTGKPFTTLQKLYITQMTGDDKAWTDVQSLGYWYDVEIVSAVDSVSHLTTYTANYTLFYSKNDAIQSVKGTHVLI